MKLTNNRLIVALVLLLNSTFVFSQNDIWQNTNLSGRLSDQFGITHYFDANDQVLRNKLSRAPNEVRGITDTIELPMPDGSLAKFSIVESSIMEDGLAEKFPEIKSYKVYGIDDPIASGRVDISPLGFRGMLMTSQGRVFIDPAGATSASRYTSSFRTGNRGQSDQPFQCGVDTLTDNNKAQKVNFSSTETFNRTPGSLTTYRLAVSATSEYVTAVGGTLATAIAAINTTINRVNQIYERDLGMRFVLVANNNSLIEGFPDDFGFSNNIGDDLLGQNQAKVDAVIGLANYDVGHIFSTGGGGVARASACIDANKANGVTGLATPTGDAFDIDYVAHEIGHQFGGNHTFNASTGGCSGGNLNAATAFEPGSGSTILSYAGICGDENIATNSDATFHAGTIVEMNTYIAGVGACGVVTAITPANSEPTDVSAGLDKTIPRSTAFTLSASGIDTGDTLSYQWDQMNAGTLVTTPATLGTDQGNNPLFRSHIPQPTGDREFPSMGTQIGINTAKFILGETLPTTSRILKFRVTARDGKSGQAFDDVNITVDATKGPFRITGPDTAAPGAAIVTWDPAGTGAGSTVICANVDIGLLTFSADDSTYGVTELLSSTANSGTADVTIPDKSSLKARFVVVCSDSIFYDISDANLTITGSGGAFPTTGNRTNVTTEANATYTAISIASATTTTTPTTAVAASGGGGVSDKTLVKFLFGLFLVVVLFGTYRQPKALKQFIKK